MSEKLHALLKAETLKAEEFFTEAWDQERRTKDPMDSMSRKYWEGYLDGLTNAAHIFTGMDADHE